MVKRLIKSSPFWSVTLFIGMCLVAYVGTMTVSTKNATGQGYFPLPPSNIVTPYTAFAGVIDAPVPWCMNTGWQNEPGYTNQCLPCSVRTGPEGSNTQSGCSSCGGGGAGGGSSDDQGIGGAATMFPCTNQPGRPPGTISETGSMIDLPTLNYVHYGWDYWPVRTSNTFSDVKLVRYYRSRDIGWWGSFGPGGFCNYDIKLTSTIRDTAGQPSSVTNVVFDPSTSRPSMWNGNVRYLDATMQPIDSPDGYTCPMDLKYIELSPKQGSLFRFEVFSCADDPEWMYGMQTEARLVRMQDTQGYGVSISYKTWTSTEIAASPERQWQIDEVTSDNGETMSFEYGTSLVGGRWAVSSITFPNGEVATYTYASGLLSEVDHADGTTTTYSLNPSYAPVNTNIIAMDELTIFDPAANPTHRAKSVYLTKPFFVNNAFIVFNQASQLAEVVTNADDEVRYLSIGDGYYRGYPVYEGAGRLKNFMVNHIPFVKDGWTIEADSSGSGLILANATNDTGDAYASDYFDYQLLTGNPQYVRDEKGVVTYQTYIGDAGVTPNWLSQVTHTDSTYETYCYNSFRKVTRYRDRLGRITLGTYDAQGNILTRAVGLQEVPGYGPCATNDTQTADYAVTTYEYYGAMDTNKYLLKKVTDPNGNATNYEYDSNHRLTKVIQPPDVPMGPRAETTYAYDMLGRLSTVTAPDGSDTTYEYDVRNRVKKITYEDGTTERKFYGTGSDGGLLVKSVDRRGAVTDYDYDDSGRLTKITTGEKSMNSGGTESTLSPSLKVEEIRTYLNGTELVQTVVKAGEKTEYVYDYRHRVVETKVTANTGKTLVSKRTYVDNKLFSTEDPYGRKTFNAYDTSDARLVRSIEGTVPSVTYANFAAVMAATRPAQNAPNATSLITDYQYNANSEVTKVTDPRGYEHTTQYDRLGRAIVEVKASGTAVAARTEMAYDDASNVTEIRTPRYFDSGDTNGHTKAKTTMIYTGRNRLKTRTEAPGTAVEGTETFSYDLMGRIVSKVDMRGKTWSTAYPACCGRTTTSTDPLGHGMITHTNANGQVTHAIVVSDVSSHMSLHNPTDNKTHREVTTKYDQRGRKVAETVWLTPLGLVDPDDPPIYTGTPVNDSANPPMASTYGLTTTWTYDDDLDDGSGLDSTLSTHIAGLLLGANSDGSGVLKTSPAGERSLSIVDGAGRRVRVVEIDSSGAALASKTSAYDAVVLISGYGNVLESASTNQAGHTTKTRTDGAGRPIESIDPAGKSTKFTYNPAGNRLSVRDPNDIGQDWAYDALGRNTQCTDTASTVTSRAFDLEANILTLTDAKGHSSSFIYDARGRRTKLIDRLGGETEWTYDLIGKQLTMTDAEEQTTSYAYDDLGRKTTTTWPDHAAMSTVGSTGYGIVAVAYTPIGQVLRMTDQLGNTVTSVYDLAGRLKQRDARARANSPTGTIAFTDSFTHDAGSRLLTAVSGQYANTIARTYSDGRLASEGLTIGGQTYTTSVAYDFSVPKITLTYPDSSTVERTLNSRSLLSTLKLGSTTVLSRVYDDGGRITQQSLGNGVVENFDYVANDNLAATRETGVGDFAFTWDANSNKTGESITGAMSGYGWSTGMSGFDSADRLVARNQGSGGTQLDESWGLSLVGDMNSATTNAITVNRTYSDAHELTAIATANTASDLKGNILNDAEMRTFQWDWHNQMKSADENSDATPEVEFTYDALRRRTSKTANAVTTVFTSLGHDSIADYSSGAASSSPLRNYVSTGRIDEPVVMVDRTAAGAVGAGAAELFYYHHDGNHHVRGLTDASGVPQEMYVYSSYGTPTFLDSSGNVLTTMSGPSLTSPLGNRFLFTSREWDHETETYHFRYRTYSPGLSQFINRDPLGYPDGQSTYASSFVPGSRDFLGLWNESGHFYSVYFCARLAGKNHIDARTMAYWTQYPDEVNALDAAWLWWDSATRNDTAAAAALRGGPAEAAIIAGEAWEADVQRYLHQLHGLSGDQLTANRDCLKRLYRKLISEKEEKCAGLVLHAFGDSYAHTFCVDGKCSAYTDVNGHLRHGHAPDQIRNRYDESGGTTGVFPTYLRDLCDLLGATDSKSIDDMIGELRPYVTSSGVIENRIGNSEEHSYLYTDEVENDILRRWNYWRQPGGVRYENNGYQFFEGQTGYCPEQGQNAGLGRMSFDDARSCIGRIKRECPN